MRTIKKVLVTKEVKYLLYNRIEKCEREVIAHENEVTGVTEMPKDLIILDRQVLSEKEYTYTMSPEVFLEHATLYQDTDSVK